MTAQGVLDRLHHIEGKHARARRERWGQRTLDLDLLAFGDCVVPDRATVAHWLALPEERKIAVTPDGLILPHPRLHERAFVLVPLADVASDWVHPVLGQTVADMLAAIPQAERVAIRPMSRPAA